MKIDELKPCRFCGGDARLVDLGEGRLHIKCDECPARYGSSWGNDESPRLLINGWNGQETMEEYIPHSVSIAHADAIVKDRVRRYGNESKTIEKHNPQWSEEQIRLGAANSDGKGFEINKIKIEQPVDKAKLKKEIKAILKLLGCMTIAFIAFVVTVYFSW
jgi:hypothetical protein